MQVVQPQTPTPPFGPCPIFTKQSYLSRTTKARHLTTSPPLIPPPSPPSSSSDCFSPSYVETTPIKAQYRRLTDNELSYFLPGRADGVNDMYLHHRLSTQQPGYLDQNRTLHVWAYLLLSHPLLSSSIYTQSYEDVYFVHQPPANLDQALQQASERFKVVTSYPGKSVVEQYLNGPRTLSAERLSCLVVALPKHKPVGLYGLPTPPASPGPDSLDTADASEDEEAEFMLCATHSIGDGMALHTFMNDFYNLLGSDKSVMELESMISNALQCVRLAVIPHGIEDRLPAHTSRLRSIVDRADFEADQTRLVGNQTFPTSPGKVRRTVVPTRAYSPTETKRILGVCKEKSVTVAHVMFALCNVARSMMAPSQRHACIIYSASNLRAQLPREPAALPGSYFHLAIGYFSVSLPSTLPASLSQSELLWLRAQSVRRQIIKSTHSPFVISRFCQEAAVRRERAVKWAKIDDGFIDMFETAKSTAAPSASSTPSQSPSKALLGVSMLGNLDGVYKHANFPAVRLKSLLTGSRQRSGGSLLFSYTFQGRLWVSLGYDVNGFKEGVIEEFWERLSALIREVIL